MSVRRPPLELWGGVECSVVRIGDAYRSQVVETGHDRRIGDLDAIAGLGIRTLRYPVLWETISPRDPREADWEWHDRRLARLLELGIRPIAGLLHHGSGPRYTNLLDPKFPAGLARHAARVAARYPWIEMFTPVNEPLTTARFSALYGHWYPHRKDYPHFLRALVSQCEAIALAMRAIRRLTPSARLVQTEDLGKTFASPVLSYQAEHENERRWLSLDLLCGRVDRFHPWHRALVEAGVEERALDLLLEGGGRPDIIGINHYLTSDRFLDAKIDRYPEARWGGNGRDRYVDVEAVRMNIPRGELGPAIRLREAWERYRLPLAATEVHNGCTREEQMRWLVEVWRSCIALRGKRVDIRAVTVWSLFGATDWNSLLTRPDGEYEPGAFDVRSGEPRPTALARVVEGLARKGRFDHATLRRKGWWHLPRRVRVNRYRPFSFPRERSLFITGGAGALGRVMKATCCGRGLALVTAERQELDVCREADVEAAFDRFKPWAVIHAAGLAPAVGEAFPEKCWQDNVVAAEIVACACQKIGIPLVLFSSHHVFNGSAERPYLESDPVAPGCAFGRSKAEAERLAAGSHEQVLIIRSGPFLHQWDRSFMAGELKALAAGAPVSASTCGSISPVYLPHLSHAALDLLLDGETGIWHAANGCADSPYDFLKRIAVEAGIQTETLDEASEETTSALGTERGTVLPDFTAGIRCWSEEIRQA